MRRRLTTVLAIAASAAVAATAFTGCSSGGSDEDEKWVVGRIPCESDCGFLRMAEHKGFFEEQGVEVEYIDLKTAEQAYPALASGDVDAIEQSAGGLLIAEAQGGMDAKVIGSSLIGMPFAIFAGPEYKTMEDLEGQAIGITSPTGLPALVAKTMLEDAGVDWDTVQPVNAGGNPDRYRALVAGTIAATADATDFIPQAEKDGINVLALSADVIPDYPRKSIIARNDSLDKKGDLAERYLAGLIQGLRYALDNPDETLELAAEIAGTDIDDPTITYTHDLIIDKGLIDRDGGINMPKLEYLEEVLTEVGEIEEPVDLEALVDDSYQKAALKRLEK